MRPLIRYGYGALALGLVLLPFAGVYPVLVMKLLCFAMLASAFNFLLGYSGLLCFGHAAFFGGAAYVAGHAMKVWGWPPELGLLTGLATGAALGAVFGLLAIRRAGIYFAMITLALAELVYFLAIQAEFTGGEDGLLDIPRGRLLGVLDLADDRTLYYVVLALAIGLFALIRRAVHSPFGQILRGIKDNEARAISLGYDVERYKFFAFVISAALAGLAGATKALVLGFATLTDVHWSLSGQVVLMTLVGGLGTFTGPAVGSGVILLIENKVGEFGQALGGLTGIEWFRHLGEAGPLVMGLIFLVCVLAFRRGVVGEVAQRFLLRRTPR